MYERVIDIPEGSSPGPLCTANQDFDYYTNAASFPQK